ncbi:MULTISPECIES: STAS domain-containing protein [unclassified Brevundimonas]|uniref:STAS domain-containing protein n=1 Tax=unclassified Brevundimonas TaxID=2622653 RepID=UPI003B589D70
MSASVVLPSVLDIRAAGPLQAEILGLRGQPLTVDASGVDRLGGLCLQVLLSARTTWAADGQPLTVAVGDGTAFTDQWAAFGAAPFDTSPVGASA